MQIYWNTLRVIILNIYPLFSPIVTQRDIVFNVVYLFNRINHFLSNCFFSRNSSFGITFESMILYCPFHCFKYFSDHHFEQSVFNRIFILFVYLNFLRCCNALFIWFLFVCLLPFGAAFFSFKTFFQIVIEPFICPQHHLNESRER